MRAGMAIAILIVITGCASSDKATWQRADGNPGDEAQLQQDQHGCMSIVSVPVPGSEAPATRTRNQMTDCMRRKGWVKR